MTALRTVSTCFPVKTQGSHVFRIFGYSQHKGIGVGKFIRSGAFSIGGHDWAIRFYPDGFSQGSAHCISVYLELLSKEAKVQASCILSLVNQITGLSSPVYTMGPRKFDPNDDRMAIESFKSRREFEASAFLRDDRMVIECVVTVMKDARVSETKPLPSPKIEVPPPDIAAHLGKLLEAKSLADVTFSVGGEAFTAHKIVLAARSPVFRAELYGPMRETAAEFIEIEDMQPDVFRALLHFVYTDSLPAAMDELEGDDHGEMVRHLLAAADRYAMDRLKMVCQSVLSEKIDVQTVATTLALADQHSCDMLKDVCLEFIDSSTMDEIASTQGFLDLKRSCPSILVDVLLKMRMLCNS
jgi:speckle-type POZ protein